MMSFWPAPAKLNLFLYITQQREDGYHCLQTLFQFIDYNDLLGVVPTIGGRIRLINSISGVSQNHNLINKAACLLQRECWDKNDPKRPGADIWIKKIIPIGSGLGGGSSNAATVLIALNNQWQCNLTLDNLSELGLQLGADVPFFIKGKASFAEGVGEILTPVSLREKWYLVATPKITISTFKIFNDPELTRNTPLRSFCELLNVPFQNDCEPIIRRRFSIVEQHLNWLLKYAPSRLTGTGACVFAEFDTEIAARRVLAIAPSWLHGFVAPGVNVSPLHQRLLGIIKYQ